MFNPQVSFVRLILGDPPGASPRYSDAEIAAACENAIKPGLPASTAELRIAGLLGYLKQPS
jgi:hypothetical protein